MLRNVLLLVCTTLLINQVSGNGRMLVPPQRSSLWRESAFYRNPAVFRNYDDHTLDCGGYWKMHENDGKCGVCGDPWDDPEPRPNEAGGIYGRGTIGRTYFTDKRYIDTILQVTSSFGGYFEFSICPNNDVNKVVTQECLDRFPMHIFSTDRSTSYGRRYYMGINEGRGGIVKLSIEVPEGLVCTQCVMQWRWHGANNYGICGNGRWGKGCGEQPEIKNCADIAILPERRPLFKPVEKTINPYVTIIPTRKPTTQFKALASSTVKPFTENNTNIPEQSHLTTDNGLKVNSTFINPQTNQTAMQSLLNVTQDTFSGNVETSELSFSRTSQVSTQGLSNTSNVTTQSTMGVNELSSTSSLFPTNVTKALTTPIDLITSGITVTSPKATTSNSPSSVFKFLGGDSFRKIVQSELKDVATSKVQINLNSTSEVPISAEILGISTIPNVAQQNKTKEILIPNNINGAGKMNIGIGIAVVFDKSTNTNVRKVSPQNQSSTFHIQNAPGTPDHTSPTAFSISTITTTPSMIFLNTTAYHATNTSSSRVTVTKGETTISINSNANNTPTISNLNVQTDTNTALSGIITNEPVITETIRHTPQASNGSVTDLIGSTLSDIVIPALNVSNITTQLIDSSVFDNSTSLFDFGENILALETTSSQRESQTAASVKTVTESSITQNVNASSNTVAHTISAAEKNSSLIDILLARSSSDILAEILTQSTTMAFDPWSYLSTTNDLTTQQPDLNQTTDDILLTNIGSVSGSTKTSKTVDSANFVSISIGTTNVTDSLKGPLNGSGTNLTQSQTLNTENETAHVDKLHLNKLVPTNELSSNQNVVDITTSRTNTHNLSDITASEAAQTSAVSELTPTPTSSQDNSTVILKINTDSLPSTTPSKNTTTVDSTVSTEALPETTSLPGELFLISEINTDALPTTTPLNQDKTTLISELTTQASPAITSFENNTAVLSTVGTEGLPKTTSLQDKTSLISEIDKTILVTSSLENTTTLNAKLNTEALPETTSLQNSNYNLSKPNTEKLAVTTSLQHNTAHKSKVNTDLPVISRNSFETATNGFNLQTKLNQTNAKSELSTFSSTGSSKGNTSESSIELSNKIFSVINTLPMSNTVSNTGGKINVPGEHINDYISNTTFSQDRLTNKTPVTLNATMASIVEQAGLTKNFSISIANNVPDGMQNGSLKSDTARPVVKGGFVWDTTSDRQITTNEYTIEAIVDAFTELESLKISKSANFTSNSTEPSFLAGNKNNLVNDLSVTVSKETKPVAMESGRNTLRPSSTIPNKFKTTTATSAPVVRIAWGKPTIPRTERTTIRTIYIPKSLSMDLQENALTDVKPALFEIPRDTAIMNLEQTTKSNKNDQAISGVHVQEKEAIATVHVSNVKVNESASKINSGNDNGTKSTMLKSSVTSTPSPVTKSTPLPIKRTTTLDTTLVSTDMTELGDINVATLFPIQNMFDVNFGSRFRRVNVERFKFGRIRPWSQ